MPRTLADLWSERIATSYGMASPRVIFADGDDPRVRDACTGLLEAGISPVLLGTAHSGLPQEVDYVHLDGGPSDAVAKVLREVADRRSWDEAKYRRCLADPQYAAAAMVRSGEGEAAVAGAATASSDVIRAALQVIGLQGSTSLLSSCFMMELDDGRAVAFGDCAVVPSPDAAQLADIALGTSSTYRALTGDDPSVAMLSFSTHGSAIHPDVDLVREATQKVRSLRPDLEIDGDLQFDAAVVQSVGEQKCPDSAVAGHANVLVFPNLAAGNIGYKIAQRLGGAKAYGPILQGLAAPMNDLSRGCVAADVVNVGLISALQAAV